MSVRPIEELDRFADELIGAYQRTLSEARSLPFDLRAFVVHVVAESARHASEKTRIYRSEQLADRFGRYYDDLPDMLGKLFGVAHEQALKWARGTVTAITSGGLAVAYAKFYGVVGALAGGAVAAAVAFEQLGAELVKRLGPSPAYARLVRLGCIHGSGLLETLGTSKERRGAG